MFHSSLVTGNSSLWFRPKAPLRGLGLDVQPEFPRSVSGFEAYVVPLDFGYRHPSDRFPGPDDLSVDDRKPALGIAGPHESIKFKFRLSRRLQGASFYLDGRRSFLRLRPHFPRARFQGAGSTRNKSNLLACPGSGKHYLPWLFLADRKGRGPAPPALRSHNDRLGLIPVCIRTD